MLEPWLRFEELPLSQFPAEKSEMDYHDDISTTLTPEINDSTSTQSATLQLYDIFIPLLGLFIISLNLLVVISSGLLLKKRKTSFSSFCAVPYIWASESVCRNKNRWHNVFLLFHYRQKDIKEASELFCVLSQLACLIQILFSQMTIYFSRSTTTINLSFPW